jgi:hypothetical protein
MGFSFGVSIH